MNSADIHRIHDSNITKSSSSKQTAEELKSIAAKLSSESSDKEETVVLFEHPELVDKLTLPEQKQQFIDAIENVIEKLHDIKQFSPELESIANDFYNSTLQIINNISIEDIANPAKSAVYDFYTQFRHFQTEFLRLIAEAENTYGATLTRIFYGFKGFEGVENNIKTQHQVADEIVARQNDSSIQGLVEANKIPQVLGSIADNIDVTAQTVAREFYEINNPSVDQLISDLLATSRRTHEQLEDVSVEIRKILRDVNIMASDSVVTTRDNFRAYFKNQGEIAA